VFRATEPVMNLNRLTSSSIVGNGYLAYLTNTKKSWPFYITP